MIETTKNLLGLVLRIALGALFLASGIAKLLYPNDFLNNLAIFSFLPQSLLDIIGATLPFIEIGLGCLILSGFCRKPAALSSALVALAFVGANAFSLLSNYQPGCGCFGQVRIARWQVLILDVVMLLMALAQLAPRHVRKAVVRDKGLRRWKVATASLATLVILLSNSAFGVPVLATGGAKVSHPSPPNAASSECQYTIMKFTPEQLKVMAEQYRSAPKAVLDEGLNAELQSGPPGGSLSLLSHLTYTPVERNQGSAGNCWVWAGTGVMEIALDVQRGVKDRLSIQYFDSNYSGGTGSSWAGCGGWLADFATFYNSTTKAIPWSNTNAGYQDANRSCGDGGAAVPAASIATTPYYPIGSIVAETITTTGVDNATAIANIKNILQQGRAISFSFYLPTSAAWNSFFSFWTSQPETAVWNPNSFCDQTSDDGLGGHSVLCVGYNDDDPNNPYWIMLNSWGTTSARPQWPFPRDHESELCLHFLPSPFFVL